MQRPPSGNDGNTSQPSPMMNPNEAMPPGFPPPGYGQPMAFRGNPFSPGSSGAVPSFPPGNLPMRPELLRATNQPYNLGTGSGGTLIPGPTSGSGGTLISGSGATLFPGPGFGSGATFVPGPGPMSGGSGLDPTFRNIPGGPGPDPQFRNMSGMGPPFSGVPDRFQMSNYPLSPPSQSGFIPIGQQHSGIPPQQQPSSFYSMPQQRNFGDVTTFPGGPTFLNEPMIQPEPMNFQPGVMEPSMGPGSMPMFSQDLQSMPPIAPSLPPVQMQPPTQSLTMHLMPVPEVPLPPHLGEVEFPGPAPAPDRSTVDDDWKERIMALNPRPPYRPEELEGLKNRSISTLVRIGKDLIADLNIRTGNFFTQFKSNMERWVPKSYHDLEPLLMYIEFIFKKLWEIRCFIDRGRSGQPLMKAIDFVELMSHPSAHVLPQKVADLQAEFDHNESQILEIQSRLMKMEWMVDVANIMQNPSVRDELNRIDASEAESKKRSATTSSKK